MRNYLPRNYFKMLLISAAITGFISCKKETQSPQELIPQQEAIVDQATIKKVNTWLDEQKNGLSAISVARIDSLKLNLSYGETRLEKYKESKQLIVIPVLSGFKSGNDRGKDPASYLVLVFENQDRVTGGNIIQYISSNSQKAAPKNTFSKIFTYQDLDCSGQFTILSVTDYFRYELKFENGKLKSVTEQRKKTPPNNGSGRIATDCIDWYLQTWYYWSDGTIELISEVFVFTTCGEGCAQPRIANGRIFNNCGGGTGSGGYPIEYEYEVNKTKDWTVTSNPINPAGGEIKSVETIKGRRSSSQPQGGYFTQITHAFSACNFCSSDNPGDVWSETSNTVAVSSAQSAISAVTGNLNYRGIPYNGINNTKTWSFQEVFP